LYVKRGAKKRYKLIVLLSDGEGHDASALTKVSELAAEGVVIHTIGIGSIEGGMIKDPVTKAEKKDALGNIILSKLNEQYMKDLAAAANGNYFHLDAVDATINSLFIEVDSAEKKALSDASVLNYETLYAPLAGVMLFLLLLELFMPDRRKK
jgi:Ca-activated chloride channel family protein